MSTDVVIHAYEATPVEARAAGGDVDLHIGQVRVWLPREVAGRLHAALGEALAAATGEGGAPDA